MEAKDIRPLMEALASVYEGYGKKKKGDCVSKSEKGEHNCAKKVCHEQYGEGECIFGQHAVPDENGFVSHYDVQFEHGVVENVSVEELEIITEGSHNEENHRYEGETIEEGEWFGGLKKKFNAASDAYNNSRGVPSPRQAQGGGSKPSITVKQTKSAEKTTPYSKTDSGKLTDFGAGGGKEKMRRTGMSAHEVEQLGRANTGKRLPQIDDHSKYHKNSFEPEGETISEMDERSPEYNRKKQEAAKKAHHDKKKQTPITAGGGAPEESGQVDRYRQMARERARKNQNNMESADLFDLMKGYLLDEGHADTEEDAMYIMANMTEESRQEIIDFIESSSD